MASAIVHTPIKTDAPLMNFVQISARRNAGRLFIFIFFAFDEIQEVHMG